MSWQLEWWHWAIFSGVLLTLDLLFINTFYLIWFGIAGIAIAGLLILFPELPFWVQITLFAISSGILLLLWLKLLKPIYSSKNEKIALRELPGQLGIVVNYNVQQQIGTLRLQKPIGGKDVWEFITSNAPPQPGDTVIIEKLTDTGITIVKHNRTEKLTNTN